MWDKHSRRSKKSLDIFFRMWTIFWDKKCLESKIDGKNCSGSRNLGPRSQSGVCALWERQVCTQYFLLFLVLLFFGIHQHCSNSYFPTTTRTAITLQYQYNTNTIPIQDSALFFNSMLAHPCRRRHIIWKVTLRHCIYNL